MFGALAQIAPDRVFACEVGGDTGVSFGGYDAERRPFVFLEFLFGSWGGRPTKDGVDACSSSVVNFSNNPIEIIEAEYPILIERYGYLPDTGGPGKFRGGLALDARSTASSRPRARSSSAPTAAATCPTAWPGGRPGTPSAQCPEPRHGRRASSRPSAR